MRVLSDCFRTPCAGLVRSHGGARGAVPVVLVADSHQEEGHGIRPARNYPVTITPTSTSAHTPPA
jgi:hypothetical protein